MTKVLSFALIAFHAAQVSAFAPSSAASSCRSIGRLCMADDAPQALSDYMAKSHEEKLRAVKDIEDKKNSEIAALKAEIQELKSNPALPAATSAAPLSNASASDAELKLASYQKFMEDYIVNAQTQKLMAVKEAELKAEKKFQERLEKLLAASGVALPASGDVGVPELSLYQKRNLKVAAAGEAGKSRWGSMEVQKAIENTKNQPAVVTSKQLAEESSVFDQRNARILAAAAAGKSRWGDMEVQRAKNSGVTPATSVAAAPAPANTVVTLEDRVNLGARLLGV